MDPLKKAVADALGMTAPKGEPKYKPGDRVKITSLLDDWTERDLIGKEGVITNVEPNFVGETNLQTNYDVLCEGVTHYMHEEEVAAVPPAPSSAEQCECGRFHPGGVNCYDEMGATMEPKKR